MTNAQELLDNKTLWKKVEYRDLREKNPTVIKYEVATTPEEVTAITDRSRPQFSDPKIEIEGELVIDGTKFPNLKEVKLTKKNLTKLTVKNCKNLITVEAADNENLTEIDLQDSTIKNLTFNQTTPGKWGKLRKVNLGKCKDLEMIIATRGSNNPNNIIWKTQEFPYEISQFVGGPQESAQEDIDVPIEQFFRDELERRGFAGIVDSNDPRKIDFSQLGVYAGSLKELMATLKIDGAGKSPNEVKELIKNGITDLQNKLVEAEKNQASQEEVDQWKNQSVGKDKVIKDLQDKNKGLEEKLTDEQRKSQDWQKKIDDLENANRILQQEKSDLSKDLIASKNEVIDKQKETIAAQQESKRLLEENNRLEKELAALREVKQVLNNNFPGLINEENKVNEEVLKEIKDQATKDQSVGAELEKIKADLAASGLNSVNFKKYIRDLEEALETANGKLEYTGQAVEVPPKGPVQEIEVPPKGNR